MEVLQLLVYGVLLGSIIALGAVGVSLTFGILGFANFSHGDLMAFGAYLVFLIYAQLSLPFWPALLIAIAGTALLAVIIDRVLYSRFRQGQGIVLLISSFGVGLIVRSTIQIIWGPDTHLYESGITIADNYWGIRIKDDQLMIIALAFLLVGLLHYFLQYTRMGKAMRAVADNANLARLSGIDTERVILWTWVIGGGLAAAAGVFLAMDTRLQPEMGWFLLLPIFAAAILGGIGKPYGAIAGGFVIGIVIELSSLVMPSEYAPVVPFAIMVGMLIVRPTGLFAGRST